MLNQTKFSSLFFNTCFDKNQLKNLIAWVLNSYGEKKTVDFLEKLKQVGFHEATQAGVSLGLEDLQIPTEKASLIAHSLLETWQINTKNVAGNMTGVEKSQQMIDIWNQMSEDLRQKAVHNFRNTNPVNPVFMMAFSGARGNISQVRQLVAMRGLMADPQGAILEFPIQSNFREGLTITEYLISCYGARKGLVDTALRTATSGYLTRRLVDAVQHIVVTVSDCKTSKGIFIKKNLQSRLVGRVLAEPLFLFQKKICEKNQLISSKLAKRIASHYTKVLIRSPLTCKSEKAICQLCYGVDLAHGVLVNIGEAVGVIAAQSIGEPGTQLTMRTFHTGGVGVFGDQATKPLISPFEGTVEFPEELPGQFVRTPHGNIVYMVKYLPSNPTRSVLKIKPLNDSQPLYVIQEKELPAGSVLLVRQNEHVRAGQLVAQASQLKTSKQQMPESIHPVKSPIDGEIFFDSMLVIREYPIPDDSKKRKTKEPEVFPVIPFLGEIGSFWVFSCFNQRESNYFKPFLHPGDLVSTESFLCQYQFHFSEKVQLKRFNSQIIVSQPFLHFSNNGISFQRCGYALTIGGTEKQKKQETDRIFYLKNSTAFPEYANLSTKTQSLVWFPFLPTKKLSSVARSLGHLLHPSYFFVLKNYSLKHYLISSDYQKVDSFDGSNLFTRATNFFTNSSVLKVIPTNFFLSATENSSLALFVYQSNKKSVLYRPEQWFANNGEAHDWGQITSSFYFVYKQALFQAKSELFFNKIDTLRRKFRIQTKKTSFRKNLNNNFLLKTLTKRNSLIFHQPLNSSHYVLGLTRNWIYIPSQQIQNGNTKKNSSIKEKDLGNFSKFIVLEQGKKFDTFVFSNTSLSLKTVPGSNIKIFPSFLKQKQNQSAKQNNSSLNKNFWYSLETLQQSPLIFLKDSKLNFNNNEQIFTNSSLKSSRFVSSNFENCINKFSHAISFYTRNQNFVFNRKEKRIVSRFKQNQKHVFPNYFVFLAKFQEQCFLDSRQLKDQWAKLQYHSKAFSIQSPVQSKQAPTKFTNEKLSNVKIRPLNLKNSGWRLEKQNFRVNIAIDSDSKFFHIRSTLKINENNISRILPLSFFNLFFYDFLFFQTQEKFVFKTFSNNWILPDENFTEGFLKIKTPGEIRRSTEVENKNVSSIVKIPHLVNFNLLHLKANKSQILAIGALIRWGQEISAGVASSCNGRIVTVKHNSITLRLGLPLLASSRGILHRTHNDLVQKNDLLVTLKSRRLQTEDIVQGIPKIEQLFEARETQGGEILSNNVHILLQNFFVEALKKFPRHIAVSKSISKIQRVLIDNILESYSNQGVKISEKHVEIIVRQMTTKVRVVNGGSTGLVQGEFVELAWIEHQNNQLRALKKKQATYEPVVLGISKSVLQSESFLLAASFQEVSRVLVRSALCRKTDFLRGLHENVILGQLIPAGTGLLSENRTKFEKPQKASFSLTSSF